METLVNPSPAFWAGKRVLVTGHTGFKGTWLWMWLRRLGAEPFGYALAPDTEPSLAVLCGVAGAPGSVVGDIRDGAALAREMQRIRPDVVLHLAAQALVRRSYDEPVETFETNVMGTIHVLEAVRRASSVRAVVVVTSDKCYENREWCWPYREDEALGGYDPYSASKAGTELVAAAWRRSFLGARGADRGGVGVATARAGNVLGGGDWAVDRLVPDCVRALGAGRTVAIRSPHATRPWQHVLEPLSGYLILAERLWAQPDAFAEAWNLGPSLDQVQPVSWVVDRVARLWGDGARWELVGGDHPHEASFLAVDASKARARMGWQPRLALHDALAWTVEWHKREAAGEPVPQLVDEQIQRYERHEAMH
jgi:CDP-glucose 4,6-dehydratase